MLSTSVTRLAVSKAGLSPSANAFKVVAPSVLSTRLVVRGHHTGPNPPSEKAEPKTNSSSPEADTKRSSTEARPAIVHNPGRVLDKADIMIESNGVTMDLTTFLDKFEPVEAGSTIRLDEKLFAPDQWPYALLSKDEAFEQTRQILEHWERLSLECGPVHAVLFEHVVELVRRNALFLKIKGFLHPNTKLILKSGASVELLYDSFRGVLQPIEDVIGTDKKAHFQIETLGCEGGMFAVTARVSGIIEGVLLYRPGYTIDGFPAVYVPIVKGVGQHFMKQLRIECAKRFPPGPVDFELSPQAIESIALALSVISGSGPKDGSLRLSPRDLKIIIPAKKAHTTVTNDRKQNGSKGTKGFTAKLEVLPVENPTDSKAKAGQAIKEDTKDKPEAPVYSKTKGNQAAEDACLADIARLTAYEGASKIIMPLAKKYGQPKVSQRKNGSSQTGQAKKGESKDGKSESKD
ncbi:hypothetical protein I316_00736 [Kwoniella heveanensis BCC8398]|uniref:Uncharacterized protein n=1 Tax=Kwoniella heveanensis BCC8398 TaxID=1296120 RepID=A0A1B9H2W8_9TREE|nr:hypothetical protein I316_00736 [Kwoniella heveanensis BCC8398]